MATHANKKAGLRGMATLRPASGFQRGIKT